MKPGGGQSLKAMKSILKLFLILVLVNAIGGCRLIFTYTSIIGLSAQPRSASYPIQFDIIPISNIKPNINEAQFWPLDLTKSQKPGLDWDEIKFKLEKIKKKDEELILDSLAKLTSQNSIGSYKVERKNASLQPLG